MPGYQQENKIQVKKSYECIPKAKKKIPVFPLTCSKIVGSVGRKKILFFKIVLACSKMAKKTLG